MVLVHKLDDGVAKLDASRGIALAWRRATYARVQAPKLPTCTCSGP
jgi:hypothetical protein